MTWNLWWRSGGNWREREAAITATLRTVRPDIAGLQEVWAATDTTQADVLAERLGMYAAFAAPSLPRPPQPPEWPDQAGVELGVGLLSRWPILRTRHIFLPSGDGTEPVALHATLDHPDGPLHVVVSCVEWKENLAARRLDQIRTLAAILADPALDGPLPVLLTADLNTSPHSPEIRALTDVAVDTWPADVPEAAGRTHSSANQFAERDSWLIDQRIDYVMARPGTPGKPVTVTTSFITGDAVDGLHPSDHFAVVTDLEP